MECDFEEFKSSINLKNINDDKFLMNIIFDELAVLCQFYETRKCKFRKCHKYFIAKKGKEKNYCCKDCADKEIKYQIREGRRSKRERSC